MSNARVRHRRRYRRQHRKCPVVFDWKLVHMTQRELECHFLGVSRKQNDPRLKHTPFDMHFIRQVYPQVRVIDLRGGPYGLG